METSERKAEVLRAIVEEYIESALPVGSSTIARSRHLGVSSATVRNDMTALERDGYITQPHTSAGRIPTDRGYRFFVDHFTQPGSELPPPQRRAVAEFFASAHHELEELLHETSRLVSGITEHAAVVTAPPADTATIRGVHLVGLQPGTVLAVAVLSNGGVEKVVVPADDVDDAVVNGAGAVLEAGLAGASLGALPALRASGDHRVDAVAERARAELAQRGVATEEVFVGGTNRLAAESEAFPTAGSATRLLALLEHQVFVVSLVRGLLDRDPTVRIGSENDVEELSDCSIVLAPYRIEGEVAGTVGVLGPTRMDYRQALAAVHAVSQRLGQVLS